MPKAEIKPRTRYTGRVGDTHNPESLLQCLDLCRIQICMSEPLLELEGRDALFRLVGGKRMPEAVTTRPLGNACVFAVFHNELSDAPL